MARVGIEYVISGRSDLRAVNQTMRAFAGLRGTLTSFSRGLLGLAGFGAGAGGFFAGIKQLSGYAGKLTDLSARTGVAIRSLVTVGQAFKDAGMDAEGAATSLNRMQRAIVEAGYAPATSELSRTFRALRLDAKELGKLKPEDQFQRIGRAIAALPTAAQRTAAAMTIFGRGGGAMLPVILNPKALDEARQKLGQLPGTMENLAGALDHFDDALGSAGNKALQFFSGFSGTQLGSLKAFADWLNRIDLTGAGRAFGQVVDTLKGLAPVLAVVGGVLAGKWALGLAGAAVGLKTFGDALAALSLIRTGGLVATLGAIVPAATAMAVAVGGAVMALWALVEAWRAWQASRAEKDAAAGLQHAQRALSDSTSKAIDRAEQEGRISPEQAAAMREKIGTEAAGSEGQRRVLMGISASLRPAARQDDSELLRLRQENLAKALELADKQLTDQERLNRLKREQVDLEKQLNSERDPLRRERLTADLLALDEQALGLKVQKQKTALGFDFSGSGQSELNKRGLFAGLNDWRAAQAQLNIGRETNRLLGTIRDALKGELKVTVDV